MKKLIAVMLIAISFITFNGCKSNRKDYLRDIEKEQVERETNLTIAADSMVHLSFGGLALGDAAAPMIDAAIRNKMIWDIKQNQKDGIVSFKSNIFLPEREHPLCVDVLVTVFNDSISAIYLISEHYEAYQELMDLYISKYSDKYASSLQWSYIWGNNEFFLHGNNDVWDRNASHEGKSWTFKNQSVHVIHEYETENKIYLKDSRMKSPENRYGTSRTNYFRRVIILYNDNKLCKKSEEYEKSVKMQVNSSLEKEREIEQMQQQTKALEQDI